MTDDNPQHHVHTDELHRRRGAVESRIKFLVCVDNGEESVVALRLACIKAIKRGGLVDILHVIEPNEGQSLFGVSDTMRAEKMEEAQELLNQLSVIAKEITGVPPELILREGNIGETIIVTAQEHSDVDMLVVGAGNGSGPSKLVAWLSSQLGDRLQMPMLLVPGNLTDQQIIEIS